MLTSMAPIAYVKHPIIARISQKISLTASYAATLYVGWLLVSGHSSFADHVETGWIIVISSCVALIGVLTAQYRFEWISLIPLSTGLLIAAVSIINVSTGFAAGLIFAAVFGQIYRFITLTIVASVLRKSDTENKKD